MPYWTVLYVSLFLPFLIAVAISAAIWGGTTERVAAALFLSSSLLQRVVQSSANIDFISLEIGVAACDLAVLAGCIVLALREPKLWIICVSSLQLLAVGGHLAKATGPHLSRLSYAILTGSSAYPAVLLIGFGVLQHHVRAKTVRASRSSLKSWFSAGPRHPN